MEMFTVQLYTYIKIQMILPISYLLAKISLFLYRTAETVNRTYIIHLVFERPHGYTNIIDRIKLIFKKATGREGKKTFHKTSDLTIFAKIPEVNHV